MVGRLMVVPVAIKSILSAKCCQKEEVSRKERMVGGLMIEPVAIR